MGDGCNVASLRQGLSLGVGNRYDWNVGKKLIDRAELREIEATGQGREERHIRPWQKGKPQVVDMEMNDVEFVRASRDRFQHRYMRRKRVTCRLVEPQRRRPSRHQLRLCPAVGTREERHLVTEVDERIRQ